MTLGAVMVAVACCCVTRGGANQRAAVTAMATDAGCHGAAVGWSDVACTGFATRHVDSGTRIARDAIGVLLRSLCGGKRPFFKNEWGLSLLTSCTHAVTGHVGVMMRRTAARDAPTLPREWDAFLDWSSLGTAPTMLMTSEEQRRR